MPQAQTKHLLTPDHPDFTATSPGEPEAQAIAALIQQHAAIAHDVNNDLSVIVGLAGLCLAMPRVDPVLRDRLTRLECAARAATAGVQRLLAAASGHPDGEMFVDLNALAREVVQQAEALTTPGVLIEARLEAPASRVPGHRGELRSALLELVRNAITATGGAGQIVIGTEILREGDGGPETLWLSVGDDGVGIDPAHLPHVFDPFFSTRARGQGSGLGLVGVRATAMRHGARVEIHPLPGGGTEVRLGFPLEPGP